jgi:hypothetical protein
LPDLGRAGRVLFGLAVAGFGILSLAHLLGGPSIGPPWDAREPVWTYVSGAILLIAAAGILAEKKVSQVSMLLAALTLVRALVVYAPPLAADPADSRPWTAGFELLALCGIALVLADFLAIAGSFLFSAMLVVIAVQHFNYARFIATLIPAWIPAHLFWAYFAGVAFVACALAILTGSYARLACSLLGLMFLLWVGVLHGPRVVRAFGNGNEWSSLLVALAMSGGAWIFAGRSR